MAVAPKYLEWVAKPGPYQPGAATLIVSGLVLLAVQTDYFGADWKGLIGRFAVAGLALGIVWLVVGLVIDRRRTWTPITEGWVRRRLQVTVGFSRSVAREHAPFVHQYLMNLHFWNRHAAMQFFTDKAVRRWLDMEYRKTVGRTGRSPCFDPKGYMTYGMRLHRAPVGRQRADQEAKVRDALSSSDEAAAFRKRSEVATNVR